MNWYMSKKFKVLNQWNVNFDVSGNLGHEDETEKIILFIFYVGRKNFT